MTTQVHSVELDGAAPEEAVLVADALFGDLYDAPARSLVWVLGCREGRWRSLGRQRFEIDDAWDGTYDERPGVRSVRVETIHGAPRPFLRVEHVDVRGGYDPRYVARRFLLLTLAGDRLEVALDTIVHVETTSGPDRADGPTTRRVVVYRRTRPASIALCRTVLRFDGASFVPDDPGCFER